MGARAFGASIAALSLSAVLFGCAGGPFAGSGPAAPDPRVALSTAALNSVTDATQPGCSAAVSVDGTVVWRGARGLADLATGEALTVDTRFDIASISKQFTATAILMLKREGKLSLDDPISEYVDGLPAWGATTTLDQLMHHESRIPDYWIQLNNSGHGPSTPATQADAVHAIAAVSRLGDTIGFEYSNSNYVLLAEVVRRVSGEPLPAFLDSRIFTPLGLHIEVNPGLQGAGVAVPYSDDNQVQLYRWAFYGPSGIITTPTELVRWADQYRQSDGTIVADDFMNDAVDAGTVGKATEGRVYGAGIYEYPDGTLRHDGWVGGYISTIKVSADRRTSVAVACNGHKADRSGLTKGLWDIWVRG